MADKLVIKNVSIMLSGALEAPILDADSVVIVDGKIAEVGRFAYLDTGGANVTVDAKGASLAPDGRGGNAPAGTRGPAC